MDNKNEHKSNKIDFKIIHLTIWNFLFIFFVKLGGPSKEHYGQHVTHRIQFTHDLLEFIWRNGNTFQDLFGQLNFFALLKLLS